MELIKSLTVEEGQDQLLKEDTEGEVWAEEWPFFQGTNETSSAAWLLKVTVQTCS